MNWTKTEILTETQPFSIKMALPSMKFKKLLFQNDQRDRMRILQNLKDWVVKQMPHDPTASHLSNTLEQAYQVNNFSSTEDFKNHYLWFSVENYDASVSFQEIVKHKLAVPKTNIEVLAGHAKTGPRKAIPKKIRGEAWKIQFGDSTSGSCYCCKKPLDVFEDWHAGHIVSHANGGSDTAVNLRPICGSCNLSMATENMDDFKLRCYPSK